MRNSPRFSLELLHAGMFGPMRHTPGRTLLAIIAIALGVALGMAVYLVNRSAADEVSRAARSLFGLADLAVEAIGDGFDEQIYPRVARIAGVAASSPVVEIEAKLRDRRGTLTILGVDAFRSRELQPTLASLAGTMTGQGLRLLDPNAVFLSADAARDLGLRAGDVLELQVGLQPVDFDIAGVLPSGAITDRVGVMDIAAAQWQFGRLGTLSRINIRTAPGTNPQRVRQELRSILPPRARLVTPGEASDEALRLSRAYRSNLTALGLVALFTGGFFVYSTQSLTTLRRRREFALLHALGVTRAQQLLLILGGGAILGICGAVLGIVLGVGVAALGLSALGGDLGAGYFRGLTTLQVEAFEVLGFCVLGAAVAVVGSMRPALEAARTPTAVALKAGDIESGKLRTRGGTVIALLVVATAALSLPPIRGLPLPGYFSIALLIGAAVIAMPSIMRTLLAYMPTLRFVTWEIAAAQLRGTARYATLSVSAIVVSFSLMVAMAIMVTSFRNSLDLWVQKILPADLYVRAGYTGQSSFIDERSVARLRGLPGVDRVELSRFATVQLDPNRPALTLIARSLDESQVERSLWIESRTDALPPAGATSVWVSETAGDLFDLQPGQSLVLNVGGRQIEAYVRGLWRDYEHQNGAIVIDRDAYIELSGDKAVNTVWMWLETDASIQRLQEVIREELPRSAAYDIRTPQELRRQSLQVFDRTFAVTYVLEVIAVVIGLFGISAGTSAQVLARRGEFGALRYLGFTRGQISTTLAIEGMGLGVLGVLAGLVTGGIVSLVLVYVVNRQSFHWSMDLFVPTGLLATLSVALIVCSAFIAMFSGRQATMGEAVRAVKEDW